jgi:hypothetical protein
MKVQVLRTAAIMDATDCWRRWPQSTLTQVRKLLEASALGKPREWAPGWPSVEFSSTATGTHRRVSPTSRCQPTDGARVSYTDLGLDRNPLAARVVKWQLTRMDHYSWRLTLTCGTTGSLLPTVTRRTEIPLNISQFDIQNATTFLTTASPCTPSQSPAYPFTFSAYRSMCPTSTRNADRQAGLRQQSLCVGL